MEAGNLINHINGEILNVISSYIELKRTGANFKACCPFHKEKTASLSVNPAKGIFKCFGCGKGGNSIEFIKEYKGVEFKEAVEIGAKKLNISFEWSKSPNFDHEKFKHLESLHIACNLVERFFVDNINDPNAIEYTKEREIALPNNESFSIGYAPGGSALLKHAQKNKWDLNTLKEIGVIKSNNSGNFDFFRDRLIFPISNVRGQTIAFAGRDVTDKSKNKYLNTHASELYSKSNELYGLHAARFSIKTENEVFIVEGYTDVLRMYNIGIVNTVATCGTALTNEQAKLLKKYTNKVTLVFDGDPAGAKANDCNAELLIRNKFHVSIIVLPQEQDPHSLFSSEDIFRKYENEKQDYIVFKTTQYSEKANIDPAFKLETIKLISSLISCYNKPEQEVYLDFAVKKIKPKKAWQDTLKEFSKEEKPSQINDAIPEHVSLSDFNKWGFYIENNCYILKNGKGDDFYEASNFILTPLFHVKSKTNSKRLFEIRNSDNRAEIIDVQQKDLVNINGFMVQIESLGDFVWDAGEKELRKIKKWLYKKTLTCNEVTQMGHQKEAFYAWGNGCFNYNEFTQVDKYGITAHNGKNYYMPAFSEIYAEETDLFKFEKSFSHKPGDITLYDYAIKHNAVFGDNGIVTLSYLLASLFHDIVVNRFSMFPILNLHGERGAGKSKCAESLLYFFGHKPQSPSLHTSTLPSIADHVSKSANAVCVLEEYRNDIPVETREFLKGLWGLNGRTKINVEKDMKKETSAVNQGVIMCGQQIPTADIALFHRVIELIFSTSMHTIEGRELAAELEAISKKGLTHITHRILSYRVYFSKNYGDNVISTSQKFSELLGNTRIDSRIYNNWLSVAAAYTTLSSIIELPFDTNKVLAMFCNKMSSQNEKIEHNDDIGTFWKTVDYLITSNMLYEGGDYKVVYKERIKRVFTKNGNWQKNDIIFEGPENLLYLSVSRVFSLYKTQVLREGGKPLAEATIEDYLKNNHAFVCDTKKENFKRMDAKGNQIINDKGKGLYTSTSALVFYLNRLNIGIITNESAN